MGPRAAEIILLKQRSFRMMRDIILQNLAAMSPRAAEIILLKQQLTRMMRDIILQKSSNGPASCGDYSAKAAIFPHDAGYYPAKFGSNGPARRGMGPRAAEWARAPRIHLYLNLNFYIL